MMSFNRHFLSWTFLKWFTFMDNKARSKNKRKLYLTFLNLDY